MKYEMKNLLHCPSFYLVPISWIGVLACFFKKVSIVLSGNLYESVALQWVIEPLVYYAIFYFVVLLVCATVYFDTYGKYDMQEAFDSISFKYAEKQQILCLFTVHIVLTILMLAIAIGVNLFWIKGMRELSIQFFKNIVVNYGLAGILSIVVGKNLSNIPIAHVKLPFIAILAFLLSPMRAELTALLRTDFSFIEIFPENVNFSLNEYIGYPIQIQRVAIIIFWIFINVLFVSFYFKDGIMIKGSCIALCVIALVGAVLPRTLLTNIGYYGTYYRTNSYYLRSDDQAVLAVKQKANFTVKKYNMEFIIRNQLEAVVSMEIEQNERQNEYPFTLYHEYKIQKVYDQDGNTLKYKRKNDYILIYPTNNTSKISIEYCGTGSPYYSESNGTYLTSGFPFFPFPGYSIVFDEVNGCFANLELEKEADFDIRIKSSNKFYCNLLKESENHFVGASKEIILLSGMVSEYTYGTIRFLYPSTFRQEIVEEQIEIFMERMSQEYEELLPTLENKTFVRRPLIFNAERGVGYDDLVICDLFTSDFLVSYYTSLFEAKGKGNE